MTRWTTGLPRLLGGLLVLVSIVAGACAPPSAPPPPTPVPIPTPAPVSSPDYGVHMFIADHPATTERDLRMATDAGFRWQKSLFQWKDIEGAGRGQFDWTDADRI
ncbi:MAG TPA: hypothetical protein VF937_08440, partial [Chloroflexota bacterium]